jgi:phosphotriesterase-related protein
MGINTVTGRIEKGQLGIAAPHEHIILDLSNQFNEPDEVSRKAAAYEKVQMKHLGLLRRNPLAMRDNLVISDVELAAREIMEFKKAGGGCIVDVTNLGLGRDPDFLSGISRETGLHIVMGSGYYYAATHPADMDSRSDEEIAAEIVSDIMEGVGFRKIKAGVIGEIAVSELMHPNEEKVIRGAALAQRRTGAGVQLHIFDWPMGGNKYPLGLEAAAIYEKAGGDLKKLSVNHLDVKMDIDMQYCMEVAKTGAYLEFDNFGHEFYVDAAERKFLPGPFETDINRVRAIRKLIDAGYADRILLSCDICHKNLLCEYGGWGYAHVLNHIVPMFMDEGFSRDEIDLMLRQNPAEFLDSDLI